MRLPAFRLRCAAAMLAALAATTLYAQDSGKALLDLSSPNAVNQFKPSHGSASQVNLAASTEAGKPGVVVTIDAGNAGYPGVDVKPSEAKTWDLSGFGHVEALITNLGEKPLSLNMRVDNSGGGGNTWNTEGTRIEPGKTGKIKVIFGYAYGYKPDYELKPEAVVNVLFFTGKVKEPVNFRVESIIATGPAGEKPPVDPKSIRIKPKDGIILGGDVKIDPATQVATEGSVKVSAVANGLQLDFTGTNSKRLVTFKSAQGKWNLNTGNELHVRVKNIGTAPANPRMSVANDGNSTPSVSATIAPGAETDIVVSFIPEKPWEAIPNSGDRIVWEGVAGTGTKFQSNHISGIRLTVDQKETASLLITNIALKGAVTDVPDWLGKRPPVEGDWSLTFNEDFNGSSIDETKWVVTGANYWDRATYWAKENLVVADGVAKMHFEKKPGDENIAAQKGRKYVCGFMHTYGKWVQRYGYFESRMKLPTAPGLWPAFWLMPDRGGTGPQWVRQDTGKGAMEFDIMEHLTRWGPYRYNIAHHWDGYQKGHKQNGTSNIYVPYVDKDGFITAGLLWLPGKVVYYCQGKEVARWEDPRISNVQSDIMFTMPTGGWDNDRVDESQLPADFVIDYVRVWQRKDLASDVDGFVKPAEKKTGEK